MHPDELLILDILHRHHWPIALRLIYADWLQENGQPDHSVSIRLHILNMLLHPEPRPFTRVEFQTAPRLE